MDGAGVEVHSKMTEVSMFFNLKYHIIKQRLIGGFMIWESIANIVDALCQRWIKNIHVSIAERCVCGSLRELYVLSNVAFWETFAMKMDVCYGRVR
jgi:hypothetical protein